MADLMALYRLADENGITVDCFPLRTREALSVMDTDGTCYIAIDPTKLRSSSDETAKLAHELGHCCTGSFYNQWATCDVRKKHENRADKWAIEHLVPRSEFQEALSAGLSDLWSLSEYFSVSEEFIKLRRKTPGFIHGECQEKSRMLVRTRQSRHQNLFRIKNTHPGAANSQAGARAILFLADQYCPSILQQNRR